jgi:hypothetical protein
VSTLLTQLKFTVAFYRPKDIMANEPITDANIGESIGVNIGINATQSKIMQLMRANPTISAKVLAENNRYCSAKCGSSCPGAKETKAMSRTLC